MKIAIFFIMLPFLLPIVLVIFFILWIIKKSKGEGWEGIIIDKNYSQKKDFDTPHKIEHFYTLVIEVLGQRTRNYAVSKSEYDYFNVGDKVVKKKGKLKIEKLS